MMGKRANRKQTLRIKKGNGEAEARAEIRAGLSAGARFRNIAAAIERQVGPERALGLVMEEYRIKAQHGAMGRDWIPDQVRNDGSGAAG